MRRAINRSTLGRLREIPSAVALARLALHLKADTTYLPVKDADSRRWHAQTSVGDFEILTTGTKWYDTRAKTGGGGAIDLAMHVLEVSFVEAVKLLVDWERSHGPDHP